QPLPRQLPQMQASSRTRSRRRAAGASGGTETGKKRRQSTTTSGGEALGLIGVALGLALGIQAFIVKPYRIPSGSMEPTLSVGQRVLVNRIGMHLGSPSVGQIVVFHPPEGADSERCGRAQSAGEACSEPVNKKSSVNFIKRIVAGPGDEMYIKEGHVFRKAKGTSQFLREKDSYIRECGATAECPFSKPIKIPAGHYFMMGDNRGESDDSRFW